MHTCLLQWHESQKRSEGEGEHYEDGRGGARHCREGGHGGGAGKEKSIVEAKWGEGQQGGGGCCSGGGGSLRKRDTEWKVQSTVETEDLKSWREENRARGGVSLCRGAGRVVEHYRERGEGGTEYRRKRMCIILLESRCRWRKRKLQRRLCSAVF